MQPVPLVCHASTPTEVVRSVAGSVRRDGAGRLTVSFRVDGDLAHIVVPGTRSPRFVMQLWEHTCFEVFVAVDGAPAYHEYNLSPSGEWAAFEFARYREVAALGNEAPPPLIRARASTDTLDLSATIGLERLPGARLAPLRIGLSAVVEHADGSLAYWALCHPPGRPDFHHASAFALRLEPAARG